MKQNSMQQVLFHFIWSKGSIKTSSYGKNFQQYKNYFEIYLWEKNI